MTERMRIGLGAVGVAVVTGILFNTYHGLSNDLLGIDAYFHLTLSRWITDHGLIHSLKWLPYTIYATEFIDDHLLFHLLLSPFTGSNLIAGGQLYAALMSSAVFVGFYLILATHGIRWPAVWTSALFLSCWTFLFRLCLVRAPSLSLLFLLLGCWMILDGKDRWLAPLGFLYTWSYGGFPLLILQTATACVAYQILGFHRWRALAWVIAGCAAGLVLNPYFPANIEFLWKSYTEIELGTFPHTLVAGNEDYPYAASTAVRKAWVVWALTFAVIGAFLVRPIQLTAASLFLFLFSIALLCLYLTARRFIEYWPPFAFLFAAFAIQHWWSAAPSRWRSALHSALWILIPILFGIGAYQTVTGMRGAREPSRSPLEYEGASNYLSSTVARDEIIFHSSWGDFPLLFYFNTHNRYIAGLGLHYLYLQDSNLYDTYVKVCNGDSERPAKTIVDGFGANYAFSRKTNQDFIGALDADPEAKRVFEDEHAIVFRLTAAH